MKSTSDIRKKLDYTLSELAWLNEVLRDESKMNEKLVLKSGYRHPEWTYNDYLTSLVSQKLILEWVIGIL
jgi:hypothetical protein